MSFLYNMIFPNNLESKKIAKKLRFSLIALIFLNATLDGFFGCTNKEEQIYRQVAQLGSTELNIRAETTSRIQKIGAEAVPALIRISNEEENEYARNSAIWLLGEIGEPLDVVAHALISLLNDTNQNVSQTATTALISLGEPAVDSLVQALRNSSTNTRIQAAYALGEIGKPIEKIMPPLINNFDDPEWNVRRVSVRALLNIGQPAVPLLSEALEIGNKETQRVARIALDQMKNRKR